MKGARIRHHAEVLVYQKLYHQENYIVMGMVTWILAVSVSTKYWLIYMDIGKISANVSVIGQISTE